MDIIPPIKDFFSIYTTAAFVIPATIYWMKANREDRKKAIQDKEDFTNNSFSRIESLLIKSDDRIDEIKIEQGKMMKKEDAYDKFVDNKTFDSQTKSFNKRFDTIEETAKENKNDLKKTAEENKNDLKDFITQSLQLAKKDK